MDKLKLSAIILTLPNVLLFLVVIIFPSLLDISIVFSFLASFSIVLSFIGYVLISIYTYKYFRRKTVDSSVIYGKYFALYVLFILVYVITGFYQGSKDLEEYKRFESELYVTETRNDVMYNPSSTNLTTQRRTCVETIMNNNSKLEDYLVKDYYGARNHSSERPFSDLGAIYVLHKVIYTNIDTCYGVYIGSYPGTKFDTLVNQDGEVVLNLALVFNANDLYDLYIENIDSELLGKLQTKLELTSGRNTIDHEQYTIFMDTLYENSSIFKLEPSTDLGNI